MRYSKSKDYNGNVPQMQHRHFAFIASALKAMSPGLHNGTWRHVCRQMARELRYTNPRFNELRFLEACGMGREARVESTRIGRFYINRNGQGYRETVDEFESGKEAFAMVKEYRISDPSAEYWVSSRCCKAWKDDSNGR